VARLDRRGISEPERGNDDVAFPVGQLPPRRRRRGFVVGFVVALIAVAIPVVAVSLSGSGNGPAVHGDAEHVVAAALGTTAASGRYDLTTTLHVDTANSTSSCVEPSSPRDGTGDAVSRSGRCVSSVIRPSVDITSHGTINLNPYASVSTSYQNGLGEITTYFNGTTVWEMGGGNYGSTTGSSLSGFAGLVEGTLGPGEGASTMISIASHGGYLSLEESAVENASPVGSGTVEGAAVTYYEVTIDVTKLADAHDITDEERTTIQEALPLLRSAGYSGTTERIGIDAPGFIREITATERFSDGSTEVRQSILSNFGCARTVYMPNETPPPATTTTPCQSPATTAAVSPSSTSSPVASTTTTPVTTTSAVPETTAPTLSATTTTLTPATTSTSP
jgi:hypothetical protein